MNFKTVLVGTFCGIGLGVALMLWSGVPFGRPREEGGRRSQRVLVGKATHLNEVMASTNRYLKVVRVINGGPELVGGDKPIATYTVTLVQEIPEKTYFFDPREYTKDIGTEVETARLCQTVASSAPQGDPQQDKSWSGSNTIDEMQISLGPLQFPLRAVAADWARLFGTVAHEPAEAFKSLDILVKGFADGTVSNWELPLLGDLYAFHNIKILRQLDSKADKTPSKFMSNASSVLIGQTYKNEQLGNLRAAFVAQDIVAPMLEGCLKDKSVKVKILEGYISSRPHTPLQRKVEAYLKFY